MVAFRRTGQSIAPYNPIGRNKGRLTDFRFQAFGVRFRMDSLLRWSLHFESVSSRY